MFHFLCIQKYCKSVPLDITLKNIIPQITNSQAIKLRNIKQRRKSVGSPIPKTSNKIIFISRKRSIYQPNFVKPGAFLEKKLCLFLFEVKELFLNKELDVYK